MWAALIATFVIGLISGVVSASGPKHLPPYLTACKKDAPDFEECCLASARAGLPYIINGVKKYGIPSFKPLKLDIVDVKSGTLHISIHNVSLWGLEDTDMIDFKFDLKNDKIIMKFKCPQLQIRGMYEMDGNIMVLSLKGNGQTNITIDEPVVDVSIAYKKTKKGEYEYLQMILDDTVLSYNMTRVHFLFENLFNGNEKLSKSTHEVLNNEWKSVLQEINPTIIATIKLIAASIINAVASHVPIQYMFS